MKNSHESRTLLVFLVRIFLAASLLFGIFFLCKTLIYYITVVRLDSPQEYREAMYPIFTRMLMDGRPVYTAASMPAFSNLYGILYSYAVLPFAYVFGSTFVVHKAVAMLFLVAALLILFIVSIKHKANLAIAALGIGILLHQFTQSFYTIGPRPDNMGFFLYVAGIIIPWKMRFSYRGLLFCAITSVFAFYTKAYFAAGALYVGCYLLLTRQFWKAFNFAFGYGIILATSVYIINRMYEFYFFETAVIPYKNNSYYWWYQMLQLKDWTKINIGFVASLILLLVGCVGMVIVALKRHRKLQSIPKPDFFITLCFAISTLLVIGKLGGNAGNYLSYYTELIGPFLYLIVCMWNIPKTKILITIFLIVNTAYLFRATNYTIDTRSITVNWMDWQTYLATKKTIFNAPPFAYELYKNGQEVFDDGHTEYFHIGTPKRNFPLFRLADAQYERYINSVTEKIYGQEFDSFIFWNQYNPGIPPYDGPLRVYIQSHYHFAGKRIWITVYGKTTFDIWERNRDTEKK